MTDIFISYAREDEIRVEEIVRALEETRWSIFWDRRIPAGKTWQSYIGQALSDAGCVIVAWSHHSITSEWVIEEANDAKERGVLVPVLLDSVKPPLGFRGIQAADLTEWKPGYSSPHFDQLIQDIAGVLGAKPPHEPPPPEHEPPATRPQEPEPIQLNSPTSKKRPNFLIAAGIALVLVIVAGWGLLFVSESDIDRRIHQIEADIRQNNATQIEARQKIERLRALQPVDPDAGKAMEKLNQGLEKLVNDKKQLDKELQILLSKKRSRG
jgi:TIR domain